VKEKMMVTIPEAADVVVHIEPDDHTAEEDPHGG
jgi:hypothetical protein